jgi:hypothetical protein
MANEKEPVVFRSEDSLWQMLANGTKNWDARRYDMKDERIVRLSGGHWEKHTTLGRSLSYLPDETFVCFENRLTGQVLQFRFAGLRLTGWAPGWCFIILGGLVATIDKDGGQVN